MKLDSKMRALLDAERFDEIEDAWMSHLDSSASDLGFFLPIVRALVQRGDTDRAELLAQLLIATHRERNDDQGEWKAVTGLLRVWPEGGLVRAALLENLERRYAHQPSAERISSHFGLAQADDPLRTLEQVETWLRLDVGQPVHMPTRGVGRVAEINLALETLRVQFPGAKLESFRIGEATQLLESLPPDHFLVQKLENASELQELAQNDAGELLRRLFASLGSPLPVSEIRTHLDGIVSGKGWAGWWKSAREDARLTVGAGSRPQCTWSDSASEAESQLLDAFEAAEPREKLELARKHAARSRALGEALGGGLQALFKRVRGTDPSLALEILLALENLPHGAEDPRDAAAFLQRDDVVPLIAALGDRRARERAAELVRAQREDWADVLLRLLEREGDSRTLTALYERLHASAARPALDRTVQETLSQPARAPRFYLWLCREAAKRPELQERADGRFLRRLIDACSNPALRAQRAALRELFDSGGLAHRVVARLDGPQAEQLLLLLQRAGDLEEHRRHDLSEAVWARFPDLRPSQEEPLYVTRESLERKRREFEQLVRVEIPRNTEEIRTAAAHGDLRENFEYKAARERQEMLSSRAKTLHEELRRARILEPDSIDASEIRVGTRVRLEPVSDAASTLQLTILGPWDSDPGRGIVSYLAPAVEALLGRRVGDAVRFGEVEFLVGAIDVWTA
ncbi:MAG: GreA/GreB family elongation factor [Candidatus Latescibacterota bacterium]|nr:MAG: GreA/GreB family elongation factor [Candidatus Latescibacterota bacterium]